MSALVRGLFFGVLIVSIGGIAFLLFRNGYFKPVTFSVEDRPGIMVVQRMHIGPYHKILDTLNEVQAWVEEVKAECPQTFGEFVDDPVVVEAERLKSYVGCVVTVFPPNPPMDIEERTIPPHKYLVAKFRGSPALGPYKVYNKAEKELQTRRLQPDGAPIEIYTVSGSNVETTYLFPVK